MKNHYVILVLLVLLLASCQATPADPSSPAIIWVKEGEPPKLDKTGTRTIGIIYKKVDLSKQVWEKCGLEMESRSDLSQILGKNILNRDEAVKTANELLLSEQQAGLNAKYELMQIEHDSDNNIWVFGYWENDVTLLQGGLYVAVDGENGELIRVWATD